jgi:hypothetical protein
MVTHKMVVQSEQMLSSTQLKKWKKKIVLLLKQEWITNDANVAYVSKLKILLSSCFLIKI